VLERALESDSDDSIGVIKKSTEDILESLDCSINDCDPEVVDRVMEKVLPGYDHLVLSKYVEKYDGVQSGGPHYALVFLQEKEDSEEEHAITRKEMLKVLRGIKHPIVTGAGCFDTGYEFRILTRTKGVFCSIGGTWPIRGPLKLTKAQLASFTKLLRARSRTGFAESLDEIIEGSPFTERRKEQLLGVVESTGEEVVKAVVAKKWPPNKRIYVFEDDCESERPVVFPTLAAAYAHFFKVYTKGKGESWTSMADDELAEWCEELECWKSEGASKFPVVD